MPVSFDIEEKEPKSLKKSNLGEYGNYILNDELSSDTKRVYNERGSNDKLIVNKSPSDILTEPRLDMQVGRGHLKLMSAKQLKNLIKKIPSKGDYRLAGKKKNDLVDYCCQRCGIK